MEGAAGRRRDRVWQFARCCLHPRRPADDQPRSRVDQRPRIGMAWRGEHRFRRPHLHDAAQIHDRDPVRQMAHQPQVVGNEQQRQAQAVLQFQQQVDDLRLHRHIQRGHRLIRNDQRRFHRQRSRDPYPLTLTAGKLVRAPRRRIVRQMHEVEQPVHPPRNLRPRDNVMHRQGFGQAGTHRHPRVQRAERVLENHLDLPVIPSAVSSLHGQHVVIPEADIASVRLVKPDKAACQGGFAAT